MDLLILQLLSHDLCGLGQQEPFGLLHDPALQDLGGVALADLNSLLQDDGAAVGDLVDEVDGGAGELDSSLEGRLMDPQAVEALAAEGGDQASSQI